MHDDRRIGGWAWLVCLAACEGNASAGLAGVSSGASTSGDVAPTSGLAGASGGMGGSTSAGVVNDGGVADVFVGSTGSVNSGATGNASGAPPGSGSEQGGPGGSGDPGGGDAAVLGCSLGAACADWENNSTACPTIENCPIRANCQCLNGTWQQPCPSQMPEVYSTCSGTQDCDYPDPDGGAATSSGGQTCAPDYFCVCEVEFDTPNPPPPVWTCTVQSECTPTQ